MKYNKLYENWNKHLKESYRAAYDAGHLRSDDERRSDNKKLQAAADEYADKMYDAWMAAEPGSKEAAHYEKEYRKHSENANRESPLPIHHLEEEKVSEETSLIDDAEVIKLLSQINDKLDGLDDIDTSIDYLISAMTGDSALGTQIKQKTLGRIGGADPRLAELIKKYQENK